MDQAITLGGELSSGSGDVSDLELDAGLRDRDLGRPLVVAHTRDPFGFEEPVLKWLGPPSARGTWLEVAHLLAVPAIAVAVAVSLALEFVRGAFLRVAVYAVLGAAALLISEQAAKPLVQRTFDAELTFPSGQWHTPLDTIGCILLSIGIVTGGAALLEPACSRGPFMAAVPARIGERGGR